VPAPRARPSPHAGAGRLRIIGGRFRGRRLPVPDEPGLRPTPDRVRETLFNWLTPVIEGARCLDPFAGSGALGLEAASRGAASVVLIERSEPAARRLRGAIHVLGACGVEVIHADALRWLDPPPGRGGAGPFDLVFLDPPFAAGLLDRACQLLDRNHWLEPGSRVYLETAAAQGFPPLPDGWELIRDRRAGQVRFGLVLVGTGAEPRP
jgi:16S rRNA (guanine966-N2)-methyltransferase